MTSFLIGVVAVFRGAAMASRAGVRHYAYMPLLINVLVFAGLIWLSGEAFDALLDRYLSGTESAWWSVLRGVLWAFFSAAMLLISFFTFTLAANLIGSPFNDALSTAVSTRLGARHEATETAWHEILRAFPAAIGQEFTKWLYFARWLIPALALFFVPGLQLAAPFIWAALAAWFVALEYLEYPASNQDLDFPALRRHARGRRGYLWGFGVTVSALALLPGINLILMPVAVAGATILWTEHLQPAVDRE